MVTALKVCIVGAGPAGLYTAERLFKRFRAPIKIDVLDRLPFPFGLVETGVAPDHPATKNVRSTFLRVLQNPKCRFYGNVELGRDISFNELRTMYHACVLACGAEADRKLGVDGENGKGVISAREFVWWFNGHPQCSSLDIDLSQVRQVAIIGAGNVAVDCARILLKPWTAFERTDMASHALSALKQSSVRDVYLIARRGVAQAKFTPKELRELVELPRMRYMLDERDLKLSAGDVSVIAQYRSKTRMVHIMKTAAAKAEESLYNEEPFDRTLHFLFNKRIDKIHLTKKSTIHSISLRPTAPTEGLPSDKERSELLEVDLLISSIGTVGVPVDDIPFDPSKGIVPNVDGRVIQRETTDTEIGVYVSGWLKRGASGIIGTNILDAEDVTEAIHEDAPNLITHSSPSQHLSLRALLSQKRIRFVDFSNWKKLNEVEQERGRAKGKDREKLLSLEEILNACNASHSP